MFVAILITLLAYQFVFAQKTQNRFSTGKEKIITKDEFNALKYKAINALESQNYRVKTVEEILSGASAVPDETRTEVRESAPDKMRIVMEIKKAGSIGSKTGFMMIGKARYSLDTSGNWILDPRAGYGSGVGSGSGGAQRDTRIYKFIGRTKLAGKPVLVYEVSGLYPSYFNERFVETDEVMRYWFSPDGKLLRQEVTSNYPALNLRVKKIVVNEYNPRLSIQAPAQRNSGLSKPMASFNNFM